MNDWNQNGKYDMQDRHIDYRSAKSGRTGASSDWWKPVMLLIVFILCPPLGIIIFLGILIFNI